MVTNKEIRYLGIWISAKSSRVRWMNRLKIIVEDFLKICKRKVFGVGHLAYIVNKVLIPKLMYISQLMTLNENDWDAIFRPVLQWIKHQLKVAKSFPTTAIFHEGLTGIENPWHTYCANQVAVFTQLVNGTDIASISTIICLRQAQIDQLMTYPIWDLSRQDIFHMKTGSKNNLALHSLIIARSLEILFKTDQFEVNHWTIKGGVTPLRPFILATKNYKWFKKFKGFTHYPIFFIDQLYTDAATPLAWRTFKELNGLSNKGRQVLWYEHLITASKNPDAVSDSERSHDTSTPDYGIVPTGIYPQNQLRYSQAHIWNFMQHCSKKRSSKPFVVFKTWDTNDRSVDAQQIYKLVK